MSKEIGVILMIASPSIFLFLCWLLFNWCEKTTKINKILHNTIIFVLIGAIIADFLFTVRWLAMIPVL